ncbi:hypothetical protein PR003_g19637 [Phytophthora rubi]|uniref:Uncharacterized protein n=1 Tax=Phytophthora rubi TaxID=129364 RepID=A0A6A4DVI5_9STRA|nr:hypothetical protein PR003_g19637 [Phytophthora rubi]
MGQVDGLSRLYSQTICAVSTPELSDDSSANRTESFIKVGERPNSGVCRAEDGNTAGTTSSSTDAVLGEFLPGCITAVFHNTQLGGDRHGRQLGNPGFHDHARSIQNSLMCLRLAATRGSSLFVSTRIWHRVLPTLIVKPVGYA